MGMCIIPVYCQQAKQATPAHTPLLPTHLYFTGVTVSWWGLVPLDHLSSLRPPLRPPRDNDIRTEPGARGHRKETTTNTSL